MAGAANPMWSGGAAYDVFMGRWSRVAAVTFLDWLRVQPGAAWVDVGCGTGALSQTILGTAQPRSIVGVDPSPAFLERARQQTAGDARIEFRPGNGQALPVPDASADATVSGLVLHFIPDPPKMMEEFRRVTRPGGLAALYTWDFPGGRTLLGRFWEVAAQLDPAAASGDEARKFPVCAPDPMQALFKNSGFRDVAVRGIEVPMAFKNFDDYWLPFLGGQGPAGTYAVGLPPEKQAALREALRRDLLPKGDGPILIEARAWAVRGVR